MATASQKMTLIRFLLVILGARTAAPTSEEPVMKIPLRGGSWSRSRGHVVGDDG